MAPHTRERMTAELGWRSGPYWPPLDAGRFWTYLQAALARFDTEFATPRPDAVTGTRHHTGAGAAVRVARYQQLVHAIVADVCEVAARVSDADLLAAAKQRAWRQLPHSDDYPTPEAFFSDHKTHILTNLLAMKAGPRHDQPSPSAVSVPAGTATPRRADTRTELART